MRIKWRASDENFISMAMPLKKSWRCLRILAAEYRVIKKCEKIFAWEPFFSGKFTIYLLRFANFHDRIYCKGYIQQSRDAQLIPQLNHFYV